MKMKSLLALAALTAVGSAVAEVATVNTLCRIEINSGTKSTIVGVPLAKVGVAENENIPVSSLVLTDNLVAGDTLLHWNGTSWDAWIVAGTDSAKVWKPTVVADVNNASVAAPAEDTALARGEAIWVNRNDPAKPFYIYGQVATEGAATESITIARGTAESPAYTLVGNPLTVAKNINELKFTGTPADGDLVVWGNKDNKFGTTEFRYYSKKEYNGQTGAWGYDKTEEHDGVVDAVWTAADVAVEPGQGFWYVSKSGDETLIVAW